MSASKIADEQTVVGPLYEFSGKLLNRINKQNRTRNVIMSPVSIHQAISMVLLGSNDDSETKQEISNTIGYSDMNEDEIKQCHQIYAKTMSDFARTTQDTLQKRKDYKEQEEKGVPEYILSKTKSPILELFTMMITKNAARANPSYEQNIKKYFHATLSNIDDKKPETKADLVKKLNDWATEAGFEGPIMDVDYLNGEFEAILLSAIRVEGFWFDDFTEGHSEKVFYNDGSRDKPVGGKYLSANDLQGSRFLEFTQKELAQVGDLHDHMSKDKSFNKLSGLNFRAIDIPLYGPLNFVIFEPVSAGNESSGAKPIVKLDKLVSDLFSKYKDGQHDSDQVTNLVKAMELLDLPDNHNAIDFLRVPKFKFESDIDLKSILTSVGLKRIFEMQNAELSNITNCDLFIDYIKHKAVIKTTKAGIKAAAVTIIKMMATSSLSRREKITRIVVRVENPFMFVLRYQKMPLFVGQLTNL
jgi:serine protease inhibitor